MEKSENGLSFETGIDKNVVSVFYSSILQWLIAYSRKMLISSLRLRSVFDEIVSIFSTSSSRILIEKVL